MHPSYPMWSRPLHLKMIETDKKYIDIVMEVHILPSFTYIRRDLSRCKCQCMAYCHYRAWSALWCWYCRSLNMPPNCPKLSMLLQLKMIKPIVIYSLESTMSWEDSLSQFPVSDELPVHGWPPVNTLVLVLEPVLQLVEHEPHAPQGAHSPSTAKIIQDGTSGC